MSIGAQKASARIAAKSAVKIRAALASSVDGRRIYTQYLDTNPPITKDKVLDRARARAWAIKNVSLDLAIYKKVLARAYADMYILGQYDALENMANRAQKGPVATASSKRRLNPQGMPIFDPSFTINWDDWEPGNESAAALLSEPGGLKKLLKDIDIQAKGVEDYSHDLLGSALADGIAEGETAVTIANSIRDSLSAPERALTIAVTEGQRARISANLDSYAANNVDQIEWTTNDPCDDCKQNNNKIVNMGDDFPSGDTEPPVHPNCQCDVIPVMPDLSGTPEYSDEPMDDSEMAVRADIKKYSPDQERDERGRFSSGDGSSVYSGSPKLKVMGRYDGPNKFFNENTRVVRFQPPDGGAPKDYVLFTSQSFSSSYVVALKLGNTPISGYSEGANNKNEVGHLDVTSSKDNPWRDGAKQDGKATVVEVAVKSENQRQGLASAMLQFHRDTYPELDVQHSDARLPEGDAWAAAVKSATLLKYSPDQERDERGRFSGDGKFEEIATEVLSRASQGKNINLGTYPEDRAEVISKFAYDKEKMGEVIHAQGWDKASIGLSAAQFDKLAQNPDFTKVYRGAPEASKQGLLNGTPWIGNGAAGPGTYVTTNPDRAKWFAENSGVVHEFLVPTSMLDTAQSRDEVDSHIVEKYGPDFRFDSNAPQVLSAAQGYGAYNAGAGGRFPGDYVIYNTSALIVKVE